MQVWRAVNATLFAARDQMACIQVVFMFVSLQAIAQLCQRDAVQLRRRHQIWPQIDQQIVVDQHRAAFAQAGPAQLARCFTIGAGTEGIGITFRSGGSQKCEQHPVYRSSTALT
jgi:hypothetical protein